MQRASHRLFVFTACCVSLAWLSPARADQPRVSLDDAAEPSQPAPRIKLDASGRPAYLARFSDGPRRVPPARGAAKEVADRLGVGSTEVARKLLQVGPSPELVRAVPGESPKTLLWPVVQGRFGRGFGFTRRARPELHHNGVDIGAPEGTVVRAAADGLVVYSDNGLQGYGNCVIILHPNGMLTLYAHNQRTTVQAGWVVQRGERIALLGQTGYAWGPHLHFELRKNGRVRDPMSLFRGQRSDEVNGPLVRLAPSQPPAGVKVAHRHTAITAGSTSTTRARTLRSSAARRTKRLRARAAAREPSELVARRHRS